MTSLQLALVHLGSVSIVVAATLVLAVEHIITGGDALGIIASIGGVSVGVGAVSIGTGQATPQAPRTGPTSGPGTAPTTIL